MVITEKYIAFCNHDMLNLNPDLSHQRLQDTTEICFQVKMQPHIYQFKMRESS